MPRYRLILPVRAIGGYRLPEGDLAADGITLTPAVEPAYTARVDNLQADNVTLAYEQAQQRAEDLIGYLALLGENSAFILDGREGLRGRNIDLEENPILPDQPVPPFESLFGVITAAGQEPMGQILDPDGSKRRSGAVVVHNAKAVVVPGRDRLAQVVALFAHRVGVPVRLRVAIGILHDAECSREPASGFAQSFTALEVLTENRRPPTLLDVFYQQANAQNQAEGLKYKTKGALLDALREFFTTASLNAGQVDRLVQYTASTQPVSQLDIFRDYLASLGIAVDRERISRWRKIRGALVHAAEVGGEEAAAMRECRDSVRAAVLEELRRMPAG
jgi:hypothetical protein